MAGQRLEVRQGQGLSITPQMQQAIKLLQMSNVELDAYVEATLESNPLLQRQDGTNEAASDDLPGPEASAEAELSFTDDGVASYAEPDAGPDHRQGDTDANGGQPGLSDGFSARASAWDGEGEQGWGDRQAPTLREHLQAQVATAGLASVDEAIAHALIDATDDDGYLREPLADIARRLGVDTDRAARVLDACQAFEPTGVMARSLSECLRLQLVERNRFDPAMAVLLDNLELLARGEHSALAARCGVDADDMADMVAEVRSLAPRPGAGFFGEAPQVVIPDVFVRADTGGGWRVELNSDTLPRLLVDKRYHGVVSAQAHSASDRSFVADCASEANWLVRAMDQRARTILKVSSEIVRRQSAFLAYGLEYMRPLTLKMVADAIGMHESTVSRATSNKYISTPRGVFEMRFFFTVAIVSADGAAHSAEAIRHRIRRLVDGEGSERDVLSDDRIVELLRELNIDIARRTVAKYRDELKIPSSLERRRRLRTA